MRAFEKPNLSNDWKCPICGTNEEKEIILIGVYETRKGNIIRAEQYHLHCIELESFEMEDGDTLIGMKFKPKKEDFE